MHIKWRRLTGVAAGAAGMTVTLLSGSAAHASTRVTTPPPKPAATAHAVAPAASTYDGKDPNKTGCAKGSYTKWSHRVFRGTTVVGNIELRYSPHCRTVWSRVTSSDAICTDGGGGPINCTYAEIDRNSDGKYEQQWCSGDYCFSPMLNDSGVTSYASGAAYVVVTHKFYSGRTASW